ncbi:hypothetical protein QEG98_03260 [Myxococcus sp. MxC21-1]|nr:hypothetical protein [Myxococcus sp. MxC21-1]WNZ62851.1 hypothetical protein QEG98_03260 [Myxococcus sp. MxC21-1]
MARDAEERPAGPISPGTPLSDELERESRSASSASWSSFAGSVSWAMRSA